MCILFCSGVLSFSNIGGSTVTAEAWDVYGIEWSFTMLLCNTPINECIDTINHHMIQIHTLQSAIFGLKSVWIGVTRCVIKMVFIVLVQWIQVQLCPQLSWGHPEWQSQCCPWHPLEPIAATLPAWHPGSWWEHQPGEQVWPWWGRVHWVWSQHLEQSSPTCKRSAVRWPALCWSLAGIWGELRACFWLHIDKNNIHAQLWVSNAFTIIGGCRLRLWLPLYINTQQQL